MLCRRSAGLITGTPMSRGLAPPILRTVPAPPASPHLTLLRCGGRAVWIEGWRTGFMVLAGGARSGASLRRTPVWPGDPPESAGPAEPAEPVAAAEPAVAVDRAAARARVAAAEPVWPPSAGAAGGASGVVRARPLAGFAVPVRPCRPAGRGRPRPGPCRVRG